MTWTEREVSEWLAQDDNPRLRVNEPSGTNAYGVAPLWQPHLHEWGSATASAISEAGWTLARQGLGGMTADDLSLSLLAAYGLSPEKHDVRLYASGTAALVAGSAGWDIEPDDTLLCHPDDTGSQVHQGMAQGGARLLVVSSYGENGERLPEKELSAAFIRIVEQCLKRGRQVLIVMTDVTKLGRVIPGESTVMACQQRDPQRVRVLVDACQGRLSVTRLKDYLDRGWRVALTGSKFFAGPPFSGALLALGRFPSALKPQPLSSGAFLRWRVALPDIQAWQRLDHEPLARCLQEFQRRLWDRVAMDPRLHLESVSQLGRPGHEGEWDDCPTIFPFSVANPEGGWLGREDLQRLFLELAAAGERPRVRWGQPVCLARTPSGERWALRLCLGVRQLLPWLSGPAEPVTAMAESLEECVALLAVTLDHVAQRVRSSV